MTDGRIRGIARGKLSPIATIVWLEKASTKQNRERPKASNNAKILNERNSYFIPTKINKPNSIAQAANVGSFLLTAGKNKVRELSAIKESVSALSGQPLCLANNAKIA